MNQKSKVKIGSILIAVIILLFMVFQIVTYLYNWSSVEVKEIDVGSQTLYLHYKHTGIDGGIKYLSDEKRSEPNIDNDLVYKQDLTIFYGLQNDTLVIYTLVKSPIPSDNNFQNLIIQKELTNPEYMNLFDKQSELGLSNF